MSPEEQAFCRELAEGLNKTLIRPVAASILYGASIGLMAYASRLFYKRRLRGQSAWMMICVAPFCFLLTTINFGGSASCIASPFTELSRYQPSLPTSSPLSANNVVAYDVYVITQYISITISDAIVIWRTQALYPDRPYLYRLPATVLVASISCLLVGFFLERKLPSWPIWTTGSTGRTVDDVAQFLSLLMNIITTILVGVRYWSHRRWFRNRAENSETRFTDIQTRVLLLFETGVLFCIIQLIPVVFTISVDALALKGISCNGACIYALYAASRFRYAFAANYSIIVLVLVHSKRSVTKVCYESWSPGTDADVTAISQPFTEAFELRPVRKLS